MKKIFRAIFVIFILFACGTTVFADNDKLSISTSKLQLNSSFSEIPTLENFSPEQLAAISNAINDRIVGLNIMSDFNVPIGAWTVGKNISPGLYSISSSEDSTYYYLYGKAKLNHYNGVSIKIRAENTSFNRLFLEDGDQIALDQAASFSCGIPLLKFKDIKADDYLFDFSEYSTEELFALDAEIIKLLNNVKDIPDFNLTSGGLWIVGEDIPAGTYNIRIFLDADMGNYGFHIFDDLAAVGKSSFGKLALFGYGREEKDVEAIELKSGQVIFTDGSQADFSVASDDVFFG